MKQVTLVAQYGQKLAALESYIKACWTRIADSPLRPFFVPYHINQVHGTIIGMEKLIGFPQKYNANSWRASAQKLEMKFGRLLEIVRQHPGFTVRFGGFQPDDTSINSFGERPFIRAFEFQWAQNKVAIMGWHHRAGDFTAHTELWALRDKLDKDCHVRHRYENDSDFFVVIGDLVHLDTLSTAELSHLKDTSKGIAEALRQELARDEKKLDLTVSPENLFIAQYEEETLSFHTTRAFCILRNDVTESFIASLYDC